MASVLAAGDDEMRVGIQRQPMNRDCFRARACRKFGAPQVMAYWCGPWRAARSAAFNKASGGSKSGKPWDRLIAPCALATRVILRMTTRQRRSFAGWFAAMDLLLQCVDQIILQIRGVFQADGKPDQIVMNAAPCAFLLATARHGSCAADSRAAIQRRRGFPPAQIISGATPTVRRLENRP